MTLRNWRTLFPSASTRRHADESDSDNPTPTDRQAIQTATTTAIAVRIQRFLGLGFMAALALVFLIYYYAHAFKAAHASSATAPITAAQQGESTLAPLGPITPHRTATPQPSATRNAPASYVVGNVLMDDPGTLSNSADLAAIERATVPYNDAAPPATPKPTPMERRLSGNVFARTPLSTSTAPVTVDAAATTQSDPSAQIGTSNNTLATLLKPGIAPAVAAGMLPTQRLLLPKGAFIDCTLETAIDSTLPGLSTCITAVDTFSMDGSVVLLERGTKLIGETRGAVEQGASRLFVLWTEARTPYGIVVNLDSPGTDELGRSGLAGHTDRHFFDRFGAAILISLIDGAILGATQDSRSNSSSVIINPQGTRDVITEVLKSTVNIPPTVTVRQGQRIQILVARDVDFRSVYALHLR